MAELASFSLDGERIRLEPLERRHVSALWSIAGNHLEMFRFNPLPVRNVEDMGAYVEDALAQRKRGEGMPFVTVEKASQQIVGSTRFGNMALDHRRVEIGWTWISPAWQRTFVNTEAKHLMLRHAFQTWGCARVEFKIHARNQRSHDALLRIGAVFEGVLRSHMGMPDGTRRDTAYFSILEDEWPRVGANLQDKLS
jgi:RimJ/RimL family protein N-acetyltransferase